MIAGDVFNRDDITRASGTDTRYTSASSGHNAYYDYPEIESIDDIEHALYLLLAIYLYLRLLRPSLFYNKDPP